MKIILLMACLAIGETMAARPKRANGGTKTSIEHVPYFVSLRRDERHVCGGALISKKHVLTAAHCVVDELFEGLYSTTVASGMDKMDEAGVEHRIIDISPHDGFREGRSSCDIAVVTLSADIEQNRKQHKIELPTVEPLFYNTATFIAFQSNISSTSDRGLRQMTVIIHRADRTSENPDDDGQDFYGMIRKLQSIVEVDAGGPLTENGTIIGVASKKPNPKSRGTNFVNVIKFIPFIKGCMGEETSPNSVRPSVMVWAPKRRRT